MTSHFKLEVRELDKVIARREVHGHLLTVNAIRRFSSSIYITNQNMVDILGNTDAVAASSNFVYIIVRFGTGTTAESATDYKLATQTETTNGVIGSDSVVGTQIMMPITGSVSPAVNRSYTEAGWSTGGATADTSQYLFQREVFAGVAVNAGQTATATFTVTMN